LSGVVSVRLSGVEKRYGNQAVVCGINLHVPAGARCVLLGPSGCGKTTTLRMVAGLENPDSGTILLDNQVVSDPARRIQVPPERRHLGMVFQSYALWPHLNVFYNVAYPLQRAGVRASEIAERVRAALALVHLAGLEDRPPHALSGGQQQRVALARAWVARPQVLLMDEPLSNLDARLRDELRLEIASLCQEQRITLLHVTHDQAEALSLATHVAVMNRGRVAQFGTPQDVYHQPASLEVARFIGDTRVLHAVFTAQGTVKIGGVEVQARQVGAWRPGSPCALAVRPEDVCLVDTACSASVLKGRVRLNSCVGASHLVDVETDAGAVRVLSSMPAAAGDSVGLSFTGGHAFAEEPVPN
jgi:ABC-type Fe3+/spermidine/putrescine transport system ATPase subunit